MNSTSKPLDRTEVREILSRHRGSIMRAAKALNVSHVMISHWLSGKSVSNRLDRELPAFALGLEAHKELNA